MSDRMMRHLAICSGVFAVVVITLMLLFISKKTNVYAAVGSLEEIEANIGAKIRSIPMEDMRDLGITRRQENGIVIPVSEGLGEQAVTLVTDAVNKQARLYIRGVGDDSFAGHVISADQSKVLGCKIATENGVTQLLFQFNSVYECELVNENGKLRIRLMTPGEVYDHVVLVDADYSADPEDDTAELDREIVMGILEQLQSLGEEDRIGIYFTRTADGELSSEERKKLLESVDADLLIGIHTAVSDDPEKYGINVYYDAEYYYFGFGSMQLADLLARNIANAVYGRANGIYGIDDEHTFARGTTIPTVELEIGYRTNNKEVILLRQTDYQKRIAEAIYQSICEAGKEMEKKWDRQ